MGRPYLAPRAVRFEHDRFVRYFGRHGQIFLRLQRTTVDPDCVPVRYKRFRRLERTVERVHHTTAGQLVPVSPQYGGKVVVRVAAVQEQREIVPGGQLELLLEVLLLDRFVAELQPVVIEATLADRYHLLPVLLDLLAERGEITFRIRQKLTAPCRMATDRGEQSFFEVSGGKKMEVRLLGTCF